MFKPTIKTNFRFDNPKMERYLERGKIRALNRVGFLSRGIMRRLFRTRKNRSKHSTPPAAPFNHVASRGFGLKMVLYAYSKQKDNVVVGPIGSRNSGAAVPGLLNDGGRLSIRFPVVKTRWVSGIPIREATGDYVYKSSNYRPRKFVEPTLDIFKQRYPKAIEGIYK